MSIREFKTIVSEVDGLELSLLVIRPETEPIGILQLAHGMCEHKARYEPFMEYMAAHGVACVINDHRGHGGSIRSEEDLGYMYDNGADALVEDLHQITKLIEKRWPGKKIVLMGHSMGSLAVRAYAGKYDRHLSGLIVCGSPGENKAVDIGLGLTRAQSAIRGERYRSKLLYNMSLGGYQRTIKRKGKEGSWLSKNAENAAKYSKDPLCNFRFTLNGYRALLQLMKRAYRLPKANNPDLPVRFYSGADDPCAPNAKGFENAMMKMRRAGYHDVKGHMFEGLRHEILKEREDHIVFDRMWEEAIEQMLR